MGFMTEELCSMRMEKESCAELDDDIREVYVAARDQLRQRLVIPRDLVS